MKSCALCINKVEPEAKTLRLDNAMFVVWKLLDGRHIPIWQLNHLVHFLLSPFSL